jgi:hypothetical protein
MKSTGRIHYDASESELLDKQMEDEIFEQKKLLSRYLIIINSSLGIEKANEVKKFMINFLLENIR